MATSASDNKKVVVPHGTLQLDVFEDEALTRVFDMIISQDWRRAERLARELMQKRPNDFKVMHALGKVLHARSKHHEAVYWLTKVARYTQEDISIGIALGGSLMQMGRYAHALKLFEKCAFENPNSLQAQHGIAQAFIGMQAYDDAIASIQHAISLDASDVTAYYLLGDLYYRLGNRAEALATYKELLRHNSKEIKAHHLLCDATEHKAGVVDGSMQAIMLILENNDVKDTERVALHLSLGRAFDAIGDADRAFEHFKKGNQLHRLSIRYAVEQDVEQFQDLKHFFSEDIFSRFDRYASGDDSTIFIVGMPRSGMGLVEQILASHSHIHAGGDLRHLHDIATEPHAGTEKFGFPDYIPHLSSAGVRALGKEYLQRRNKNPKKRYITDSSAHNFRMLGMAHLLFPQSKIIHCVRHPLDLCLSAYQHLLPETHPYSYDLRELGEYMLACDDLMAHWKQMIPSEQVLTVSYEELVYNPQTVIHEILNFLGLEFESNCLDFANTRRAVPYASAKHIHRPLSTMSIEKWHRYNPYLSHLKQMLGFPDDAESALHHAHKNKKRGNSLSSLKSVTDFKNAPFFRGGNIGIKH